MSTLPDPLAGAIADHIGQLDALYLARVNDTLAGAPITAAEFVALIVLEAHPDGLTQTAWGQQQGVSRQRAHTVTKNLTGLGYLTLERQGRSSRVGLSESGRAFLEDTRPSVERTLGEAMHALSREEGEVLLALLTKLLPR